MTNFYRSPFLGGVLVGGLVGEAASPKGWQVLQRRLWGCRSGGLRSERLTLHRRLAGGGVLPYKRDFGCVFFVRDIVPKSGCGCVSGGPHLTGRQTLRRLALCLFLAGEYCNYGVSRLFSLSVCNAK